MSIRRRFTVFMAVAIFAALQGRAQMTPIRIADFDVRVDETNRFIVQVEVESDPA